MSHPHRIYIDSRLAVAGSAGSFEVDLPEVFEYPQGTACWLSEATLVSSWQTVNDTNHYLYLIENSSGSDNARLVEIPNGPYDSESLRSAVETALNTGTLGGMGSYSVTRSTSSGISNAAGVVGAAAYRFYHIACSSGTFAIPPDSDLQEYKTLWGIGADETVRSTNELFQFPEGVEMRTSHTSSFIDLRGKHTIFLHCSSIAGRDTIGPGGRRTAIAKIPCDVGYGGIIHYQHTGCPFDVTEMSSLSLKRLRFNIADAHGNTVDFRGSHVSFTLCFGPTR